MRKILAGLLLAAVLTVPLTSCKNIIEGDDLAYVASIGIDRGVSDYWRLTVKYPIMRQTQQTGQPGGEANEYDVVTMDAPSFFTGIDMINANITRHLNFQHVKFIVISEELARSGSLGKYLSPIIRYREIRRTAHVLVSRGTAKEFLENNKPALGNSLTKNMEDWITSTEYVGFFGDTMLKDFYNKMKSPYQRPTAILAATNKGENFVESGLKADRSINMKAKYTAGQLPETGGNEVELFGSAVFDGDKMVETLDGYETRLVLMVRNEFVNGNFSVPDPKAEGSLISLRLEEESHPDIRIDLKGGNPRISVRLKLGGEILGLQSGLNYEGAELKPVLEQSVAMQLKEDLGALFKKCKVKGEDIFGFGGVAAQQFATVGQWEQYDWFKQFENAQIDTDVGLIIKRSGTFIKTYPVISTKGEGG